MTARPSKQGPARLRAMQMIVEAGKKGLPRAYVLADLQKRLRITDEACAVMFAAMVGTKQIAVIGQAIQGNYPGVALNVKIYAVYGTPILPGASGIPIVGSKPGSTKIRRSLRRSRGSGVIAPPPYKTGLRWGLI